MTKTAKLTFSNRNGGLVGLIIPSSNTNLEPDCALLVPSGVTVHSTRIGGYEVDGIPDSAVMKTLAGLRLDEPIKMLMDAKVDVIGYGCASATLSCGWDYDRQLCMDISEKAGVPAVTTSGAMVEMLRSLDISSIGFASPYVEDLNKDAVSFFESAGISVVKVANVGSELSSAEQGKLTPQDAFDLGFAANHKDAQAIVIGCTDFRAVEAIEALENELEKPVITSNQALIKRCLMEIGLC